jgi:hypothetical protein
MLDPSDRRSSGAAVAGLILLIIGGGLVAGLFLFEPWLSCQHVINAEFGGWLDLGCIVLATMFGGSAWRSPWVARFA